MLNFISQAQAQSVGSGGSMQSTLLQFVPFVLIFLVLYFLMLRPQNKRAKEHRDMIASLKRGDKVVTSGGLIGTVSKILDDHQMMIELAPDMTVTLVKSSVTQVLNKTTNATRQDPDARKTESATKRVSNVKKKK